MSTNRVRAQAQKTESSARKRAELAEELKCTFRTRQNRKTTSENWAKVFGREQGLLTLVHIDEPATAENLPEPHEMQADAFPFGFG